MRPPRLIPTPSLKSASNMTIISNYSPHRPEVLVITNGRTQLKGRGALTARPFALTFVVSPSHFNDEAIPRAYGLLPICHVPKLRKAARGVEVSLTAPFPHEPPHLSSFSSTLSTSAANPSCADRADKG